MSSDISNRIELIISHFGHTKNSFSKAIGLSNNVTIGRIVNENNKPSYEVIEKIVQTFGSINAKWLLIGEGEMISANENLKQAKDSESVAKESNSDFSSGVISELRKEISQLNREIGRLEAKLELQKQTIIQLRDAHTGPAETAAAS